MGAIATYLLFLWLLCLTIFVAQQEFGDLPRWQQVGDRLRALESAP